MSEARPYIIGGYTLRCQHCSGSRFRRQTVEINRQQMGGDFIDTFFNLLNQGPVVHLYACDSCGCVQQFLDVSARSAAASPPPSQAEETFACLNCQTLIPAGSTRCKDCGWSYE